jgi:xanthine dehydrogenase iron-sulfur cluster and FAD-binding subunit A
LFNHVDFYLLWKFVISNAGGKKRKVTMNESFWTGYRKNIVRNDEILISIHIPFTDQVLNTKKRYFQFI